VGTEIKEEEEEEEKEEEEETEETEEETEEEKGLSTCFRLYRTNSQDRRCRTCISLETQSLH
jgi:hypothetical protein